MLLNFQGFSNYLNVETLLGAPWVLEFFGAVLFATSVYTFVKSRKKTHIII